MALTDLGRELITRGMENLGASLSLLEEMVHECRSDEEIARKMEVYANAAATFTRSPVFVYVSITAHGKFGKSWRELLTISREMFGKMQRWQAAGYTAVAFQRGNKSCWPVTDTFNMATSKARYMGDWTALNDMVSVYCRGGVIEDPKAEEVETND